VSRWDRATRVESRTPRGWRSATGRLPGASDHYDWRVWSARKTPNDLVTNSLARGDINRSVGRPLAGC
jgi:hypothetical protein